MTPDLVFQVITLWADIAVLAFVIYYYFHFHAREREMEEREKKADTDYHAVVNDAQAKERKIIEDATAEATKIIADAKTVTQVSRDAVGQALEKMTGDIQKEAGDAASNFVTNYQAALKQIATDSLSGFQTTTGQMQTELAREIKAFQEQLLPRMQGELDEYKNKRMQEVDKMVAEIIRKVSAEVLNKSISLEDHQNLVVDALDKAKKEGVFD